MKLYTDVVKDLRMCTQVNNPGATISREIISSAGGGGVSFCNLTRSSSITQRHSVLVELLWFINDQSHNKCQRQLLNHFVDENLAVGLSRLQIFVHMITNTRDGSVYMLLLNIH